MISFKRTVGTSIAISLLLSAFVLGGCGDDTTGGSAGTGGTGGAAGMGGSAGTGGAAARVATATIDTGTGITGTVTFTEMAADSVHIVASFTGFDAVTPERGFHVHEHAMCGGDHMGAGAHWNPAMAVHACPPTEPRHAGDVGNIKFNPATGKGEAAVHLTGLTFDELTTDKAVVLHEGRDDCTTQPSGNSGARIGCGPVVKSPVP